MRHASHALTALSLMLLVALFSLPLVHAESTAQLRARKLRKGINVGTIGAGISPECCGNVADVQQLQRMGFDHVRLGVQLSSLFNCKKPHKLEPAQLHRVLDSVKTFTDGGMPVIVTVRLKDAHGDVEFDLQKPGFVDQLAKFWRSFSSKLSHYPADKVFLEVLNEPYEDHRPYDELMLIKDWIENQQPKLIKAIRKGAHSNTIIATGARGSTVYGLLWLDIRPLNEAQNVIYSFHYYQPDCFARHGWGLYPAPDSLHETTQSSCKLQKIDPRANHLDEQLTSQDRAAGGSSWDKDRIGCEMDAIADWGVRNNAAIISDEFGVKKHADEERRCVNQELQDHHSPDRAIWIADVRSQLDAHGIGWTFWDYSDCPRGGCGHDDFGLIDKSGAPDNDVLQALGLGKQSH